MKKIIGKLALILRHKFYMLKYNPCRDFILRKTSFLTKFNDLNEVLNISPSTKKVKNLFVISNLGQLQQAESLIRKENIKNNAIVMVYTNKNKEMPKIVVKNITKTLFNKVYLLRIENKPNDLNIKNMIKINNGYKNLLNKLEVSTLFVFSFQMHYALLINHAERRSIPVNLVEEGAGTYRYASVKNINKQIRKNIHKNKWLQYILIKYTPFFLDLRPVLTLPKKFNIGYLAFPNMLDNVFFFSKKKYFFLYDNCIKSQQTYDIIKKYNMKENEILFLNQRYSFPVDKHAKVITNILLKHSEKYNSAAYIKLHPKDTEDVKVAFMTAIKDAKAKNIYLIDEKFTIEPLISIIKPNMLLSLTSTSLIYGKLISNTSKARCIYPLFKSYMIDLIEKNKFGAFKETDEHYIILRQFDNIEYLEQLEDI